MKIDGNAWSARFKRLMSTNSVVLKSTMFPEWYADRIQEWVHYVPVKVYVDYTVICAFLDDFCSDLSDLYDIMSFFHNGTNDDLAASIAKAGKEWSHQLYRKEDMGAYMFRQVSLMQATVGAQTENTSRRLYLEYARVMSVNRDDLKFEL